MKIEILKAQAKVKLASLPLIGNPKRAMKEMKKLKMLTLTKKVTGQKLAHFRWHNEIHDCTKLLSLIQYLDKEEAELFDIDLR